MRDTRGTRAGRQWAAQVITANPACVQCGHTGSEDNPLQADHIQPVDRYPELSLDLSNGQTLCRKHNIAKSNKTEAQRVTWFNRKRLSSIE